MRQYTHIHEMAKKINEAENKKVMRNALFIRDVAMLAGLDPMEVAKIIKPEGTKDEWLSIVDEIHDAYDVYNILCYYDVIT